MCLLRLALDVSNISLQVVWVGVWVKQVATQFDSVTAEVKAVLGRLDTVIHHFTIY
jgi:hypothetical protein